MLTSEVQRRLRALLATATLPPPALPRYAFAVYSAMVDSHWRLVTGTVGGECVPLTARLVQALYTQPVYLYGRTTALLTATEPGIQDNDPVGELEVLTIHGAADLDGCGQAQLRTYVTPDSLEDPLLFVTAIRPVGWPP